MWGVVLGTDYVLLVHIGLGSDASSCITAILILVRLDCPLLYRCSGAVSAPFCVRITQITQYGVLLMRVSPATAAVPG